MSARRRRDATWLLTSGLGQAGLAFAANLALVRLLSPEDFGRFALALAAVTLVTSLVSLRTSALAVRARSLGPRRRRLYLDAALFETALALGLAGTWLHLSGGFDLWMLLLLAGCGAKHIGTVARTFLERAGRWRRLAAIEGGVQLAGHTLAVVLALFGLTVGALVMRELAIGALTLGVLAAAGALPVGRPRLPSLKRWRVLARQAKDLWLDGALEGAFARALVLAAGAVAGERGAGLFAQAHRLAVFPHQLLSPLAGRLAYHWFSRSSREEAQALRGRLAARLALPLGAAALGALLLADPIVPWMFGPAWRDAAPLLAALCGVVLFNTLYSLVKMQLASERRLAAQVSTRLVQFAGLALGVGFALLGSGGVAAVAWGISAGYAAATWTGAWALAKPAKAHAQRPSADADQAARARKVAA